MSTDLGKHFREFIEHENMVSSTGLIMCSLSMNAWAPLPETLITKTRLKLFKGTDVVFFGEGRTVLALHDKLLIACGQRAFLVSVFFFFAMVSNAVDTMRFLR